MNAGMNTQTLTQIGLESLDIRYRSPTVADASTRYLTILMRPCLAANINGVVPFTSTLVGEAPAYNPQHQIMPGT